MLKAVTFSILFLTELTPALAQQIVPPPAKIEGQPLAPPAPPASTQLPAASLPVISPSYPLPQTLPTIVPPPAVIPLTSTPAPLILPSTPLPQVAPQQVISTPVNPPMPAPVPAQSAPAQPAPAQPAPAQPAPAQPVPALIVPPAIISPDPANEPNILELNIEARPVLTLKDEASNEDGFTIIRRNIARLTEDAKNAGIVITGRPFAVIDLTDDQRFKFEVMLPVEKPVSGIAPAGLNFGLSPMGKAIRFKFTGAYDESAYVYESIEAYIEEKNIIARNYAIEEYLNDPKDNNDADLQMYIYYLKE